MTSWTTARSRPAKRFVIAVDHWAVGAWPESQIAHAASGQPEVRQLVRGEVGGRERRPRPAQSRGRGTALVAAVRGVESAVLGAVRQEDLRPVDEHVADGDRDQRPQPRQPERQRDRDQARRDAQPVGAQAPPAARAPARSWP